MQTSLLLGIPPTLIVYWILKCCAVLFVSKIIYIDKIQQGIFCSLHFLFSDLHFNQNSVSFFLWTTLLQTTILNLEHFPLKQSFLWVCWNILTVAVGFGFRSCPHSDDRFQWSRGLDLNVFWCLLQFSSVTFKLTKIPNKRWKLLWFPLTRWFFLDSDSVRCVLNSVFSS